MFMAKNSKNDSKDNSKNIEDKPTFEFKTSRYKIGVWEIANGGPSGYESTYLSKEGYPATEEMYETLSGLEGTILSIENRIIRQRNADTLVEALSNGKRVGIASGFKPSGAFHFGHQATAHAISFFQKNGVQVFIPVADIEAEMDTKLSEGEYRYWAADNLVDWGAAGINLDAAHVYLQSEEFRVNGLAYVVARSLNFDLAVDI